MKWIMGILILGLLLRGNVQAAEELELSEELFENYDFGEINDSLQELFPEEKIDFKETVLSIISGEMKITAELFNRLVKDQTGYVFAACKSNLITILLIALMAAVFSNFSKVFQNRQVSEMSFYILYLLLITLCLSSFQIATEWVNGGVENILNFMSAFCPIYFVAISVAKGSITAAAFYNLILFLIYFVEVFILKFLLPVIHVYIMIRVLNHLSEEDYLSKFAELLEILISWILKSVIVGIVGINVMQGLIHPAIDTVKRSTVTKTAEAIPGVGDAIGGTVEVLLGASVLIKNGIGMAGTLICIALCVVPLMQIALVVLLYKLSVAVIQPVSDRRIVGCIESVSEGCRLLMKVIYTTGILFLLTVVIVTTLTNGG